MLKDDFIYGQEGDDFIDGGAGNDYLMGGRGDDTIHGGEGDDWIEDFQGRNELFGGAGNDTLISSGGSTLTGGEGEDLFYMADIPGQDSHLRIIDFTADDRLDIREFAGTDGRLSLQMDRIAFADGAEGLQLSSPDNPGFNIVMDPGSGFAGADSLVLDGVRLSLDDRTDQEPEARFDEETGEIVEIDAEPAPAPVPEPEPEPVDPEGPDDAPPEPEEPQPEEPHPEEPQPEIPDTPGPQDPDPETPQPEPPRPTEPEPPRPDPERPEEPDPEEPGPEDDDDPDLPGVEVPDDDEDRSGEGDEEAGASETQCAMVAAFGGLSPLVAMLRDFRDRHLVTHPLGRAMIRAYWVVSPSLSGAIRSHRPIGAAVRQLAQMAIRIAPAGAAMPRTA